MAGTYPLELSLLESSYISDAVSEYIHPLPPPDGEFHAYPFLLKVGSAILEITKTKKDAVVEMSVAELRMIREVSKSSVVVGSERVGLNLMLKVYEGLIQLESASYTDAYIDAEGGPELNPAELSSKLNEFRKTEAENQEQPQQPQEGSGE